MSDEVSDEERIRKMEAAGSAAYERILERSKLRRHLKISVVQIGTSQTSVTEKTSDRESPQQMAQASNKKNNIETINREYEEWKSSKMFKNREHKESLSSLKQKQQKDVHLDNSPNCDLWQTANGSFAVVNAKGITKYFEKRIQLIQKAPTETTGLSREQPKCPPNNVKKLASFFNTISGVKLKIREDAKNQFLPAGISTPLTNNSAEKWSWRIDSNCTIEVTQQKESALSSRRTKTASRSLLSSFDTERLSPIKSYSSGPRNTCLIAEEVYNRMRVKEKIQLFNQFINERHPRNGKLLEEAQKLQSTIQNKQKDGTCTADVESDICRQFTKLLTTSHKEHFLSLSAREMPAKSLKVVQHNLETTMKDSRQARSLKRKYKSMSLLPQDCFSGPRKIRRQGEKMSIQFYEWLRNQNSVEAGGCLLAQSEKREYASGPLSSSAPQVDVPKSNRAQRQFTRYPIYAQRLIKRNKYHAPQPPRRSLGTLKEVASDEESNSYESSEAKLIGAKFRSRNLKSEIMKASLRSTKRMKNGTKRFVVSLGQRVRRTLGRCFMALSHKSSKMRSWKVLRSSEKETSVYETCDDLIRRIEKLVDDINSTEPSKLIENFQKTMEDEQEVQTTDQAMPVPCDPVQRVASADQGFESASNGTDSPFTLPSSLKKPLRPSLSEKSTLRVLQTTCDRSLMQTPGSVASWQETFDETIKERVYEDEKNDSLMLQFWLSIGNTKFAFSLDFVRKQEVRCQQEALLRLFDNEDGLAIGIDQIGYIYNQNEIDRECQKVQRHDAVSVFWISHKDYICKFIGPQVNAAIVEDVFRIIVKHRSNRNLLFFGIGDIEFSSVCHFTFNDGNFSMYYSNAHQLRFQDGRLTLATLSRPSSAMTEGTSTFSRPSSAMAEAASPFSRPSSVMAGGTFIHSSTFSRPNSASKGAAAIVTPAWDCFQWTNRKNFEAMSEGMSPKIDDLFGVQHQEGGDMKRLSEFVAFTKKLVNIGQLENCSTFQLLLLHNLLIFYINFKICEHDTCIMKIKAAMALTLQSEPEWKLEEMKLQMGVLAKCLELMEQNYLDLLCHVERQ